MKPFARWTRPVVCALGLFCAVAAAQTNRGGMTGTVVDQSGAVVASATVIITNLGTNQVLHLKTSSNGSYSASNLEPVMYRVEVSSAGFKKAVVEQVKVDTAAVETVNVMLQPGDLATEVSVTAEAPTINLESGTTSQTITERLLTDVPLTNRSVLDLVAVTPNVSGDGGTEDPQLNFNGGRPGTSYMIADGVSNTGVGLGREVVAFSPETVQELTVQTSASSAAFGNTGGGVINVTTKSGTNTYHGAGLVYHRDPATNAAPWAIATPENPSISNLRYTQMSFTLGGPVNIPKLYHGHDRTFFFVALEPRHQSDVGYSTTLLPTDAMRNGDFSNLVNVVNGWVRTEVFNRFEATLPAGRTLRANPPQDTTIYQ